MSSNQSLVLSNGEDASSARGIATVLSMELHLRRVDLYQVSCFAACLEAISNLYMKQLLTFIALFTSFLWFIFIADFVHYFAKNFIPDECL